MGYKKKAQIQKIIFSIVSFIGIIGCGACVGAFLSSVEKQRESELNAVMTILTLAWGLIFMYLAYLINMYLHEVGHVIFGLITGYHFASLRFGKIILTKSEGRLKIQQYSLPGTGGQAIMLPPSGDDHDYPVFWYNAGGLIVNLLICVICTAFLILIPSSRIIMRMILLSFVASGTVLFIINALPLTEIGTDGANIIILRKDKNARLILRKSLQISKCLSDNIPLNDMPESLFAFDKDMKLDNPLVTSQAVNRFSYLVMNKRLNEAYEVGEYILANATSINQIHELDLKIEMIYIMLVEKGAYEEAKNNYLKDEKQMKRIAALMSYQRSMYAYYQLAEPNEEKAKNSLKIFEKIAKHYPYQEDIKIERSLIEYVDSKLV